MFECPADLLADFAARSSLVRIESRPRLLAARSVCGGSLALPEDMAGSFQVLNSRMWPRATLANLAGNWLGVSDLLAR